MSVNAQIPVTRSEFIEVVFNAIEKGEKTKEFEITAIAEVIAMLYSRIETQGVELFEQNNLIQSLQMELEMKSKDGN